MKHPYRFKIMLLLGSLLCSAACGDDDGDARQACKPGEAGCPCSPDGACADGLECIEARCTAEGEAGLVVSDERARACDLLLLEKAAQIRDVAFGEGVKGTFVREAPRVAVSFIARADAPIAADSVRVRVAGTPDGFGIEDVSCSDADGSALPDATISVRK